MVLPGLGRRQSCGTTNPDDLASTISKRKVEPNEKLTSLLCVIVSASVAGSRDSGSHDLTDNMYREYQEMKAWDMYLDNIPYQPNVRPPQPFRSQPRNSGNLLGREFTSTQDTLALGDRSMISTTQKSHHVEDSREQAADGCADTILRLRNAKSTDVAKPDAEPTQIESAVQRKSYAYTQDLIDQAYADYWTL